MERDNRCGRKTYAVDENIQGDYTHVGDPRAGNLCRYSKGQDIVQTTHGCYWKAWGAALNCILSRTWIEERHLVNGIIYEQRGVGGITTHVPSPHNRVRYLAKERDMTCQKCNGLLISERNLEFYAHTERWKCINCGWHRQDNPQFHQQGRYSANRGTYK